MEQLATLDNLVQLVHREQLATLAYRAELVQLVHWVLQGKKVTQVQQVCVD
jgi:hypothetical protein